MAFMKKSLNEDMIIQTFPFLAALEARNILLLQSENGTEFKNHEEVSKELAVPLDSVFTTLLKRAYERGSNTLLEGGVQTKFAFWLPPDQLLLGVKHVLLYLKSTVENFSSARAIL